MRNTMMRDKLSDMLLADAASLSSNRTNQEILSAVSAVERKMKKDGRKPRPLFGPRYITPPKRLNPFSVHAHSVSAFLAVDDEKPADSLDTKLRVESHVEEVVLPNEKPVEFPTKEPLLEGSQLFHSTSNEPVATVPANLISSKDQTAFSPELNGMVAKLRTAKSAIAFTLEQLRTRRKKTEEELAAKQRDLEGIDRQIEHERENLRRIDETIEASALLAEQAAGIDPGLLSFKGAHHKGATARTKGTNPNQYAARWDKNNPTIMRLEDVRQFFVEHPDVPQGKKGWDAMAILGMMPAIKQAHGKTYLPSTLTTMTNAGEIERVDRGFYRAKQ